MLLHEGKGVDKEEIGLEVAYEDAYAMRTSTRQGGALWTGALIPRRGCLSRYPGFFLALRLALHSFTFSALL